MNETWKPLISIVENGEYYEVSTHGRVRSIDRIIVYSDERRKNGRAVLTEKDAKQIKRLLK
ncbi:NUMOD4 domain-containing protein [Bacillus albus]|uniref:NUMOD4 domain-containing protein n=1 Tax=Bacillus albus TaxID=2026189 RepID=UPI00101F8CDD|nr:NUMOD4 domain-containing protein [Bacillus albus]